MIHARLCTKICPEKKGGKRKYRSTALIHGLMLHHYICLHYCKHHRERNNKGGVPMLKTPKKGGRGWRRGGGGGAGQTANTLRLSLDARNLAKWQVTF